MSELAFYPTPETYQQALTSLKELGEIQLRFVGELAEKQREFVSTLWQHQIGQAKALTETKDVNQLFETVNKASTEEIDLVQKHTKATFDLFNTTGKAVSGWYDKQLAGFSPSAPPAPTPAPRVSQAATKAA